MLHEKWSHGVPVLNGELTRDEAVCLVQLEPWHFDLHAGLLDTQKHILTDVSGAKGE